MTAVPVGSPRASWTLVMTAALVQAGAEAATSIEVWLGWAPTTLSSWEGATLLGSVLACACAAWVTGQGDRHAFAQWRAVSPRPWAADAAPAAFFVSSAVVVGHGIVLLVMLAASMHQDGHWGTVGVLWLVVPTAWAHTLVWAGVGSLLGRVLPFFVALGTTLVLPYAFSAVVTHSTGQRLVNLTVGQGIQWNHVRPSNDSLVLRLLAWALVSTVLLVGMVSWKRSRGWLVAAGLTVVVGISVGPRTVPIPHSDDVVCEGGQPVVCVDAAHAGVLGRYRRAVDRLWSEVPTALRADVVVQDEKVAGNLRGPGRGSVLVAGPVADNTEPSRVVDPEVFAHSLGRSVLNLGCTPSGIVPGTREASPERPTAQHGQGDDATPRLVLLAWWRLTLGLPLDGSGHYWDPPISMLDPGGNSVAAAKGLQAMEDADRDAWFTAFGDNIRGCTHDEIVLP